MISTRIDDSLSRLRAYINEREFALNDRLPPERSLCRELGLTRTALREALGVLETEGQVWRQVGRGTFIGARSVLNLSEVHFLSSISTASQISDARLVIEPELTGLAAKNATANDLAELRMCLRRCSEATSWRVFEAWDNRFHYAIAASTRNKLLMAMFETVNAIRRSPTWQTVRTDSKPAATYSTFIEHREILDSIEKRNPESAVQAMRTHLQSVRTRLLTREAGEAVTNEGIAP